MIQWRAMTKHYRLDPKNPRQLIKSDFARLDRMTDEEIDYSDIPELGDEFFAKAHAMIDWTRCDDVESVPGRCSGAWVAKDSRVMVEGILENAEDASAEEVADMFELPVEQVRRILDFAGVPNWPACPDAERPGGQWVVKGSTVSVQTIIDECWTGQIPQTTAELHGLRPDVVRRILAFAGCFGRHEMTPPR